MNTIKTNYRRGLSLLTQKSIKNPTYDKNYLYAGQ